MTWDELETEAEKLAIRKGPLCGVANMVQSLPEDAAIAIRNALANPWLSTTGLRRALVARLGEEVVPTRWVINHHRRGECSCKKGES